MLERAAAELARAPFYPERAFADFRDAVADWLGVPFGCVVPAHGAQALIGALATAFIDTGTAVVVPKLTYGLYAQVSAVAGATITRVEPDAGFGMDLDAIADAARSTRARLVWLCDPNNPTGTLVDRGPLARRSSMGCPTTAWSSPTRPTWISPTPTCAHPACRTCGTAGG